MFSRPNVKLVEAQESDLDLILSLFELSIMGTVGRYYRRAQCEAWKSSAMNKERWLKKIVNQHFILAKSESELLAFASLEDRRKIDLLYVSPAHQRKGLANFLLHKLEQIALEFADDEAILVETFASKAAKPFFESSNYMLKGKKSVYRNGIELTNYHMVKTIP